MRILIAAALIAAPAAAHEWYPAACCSNRDCFAVPASEVRATAEGWLLVPTGQVIPYDKARVTPDEGGGQFHVCTSGGFWPGSVLGSGMAQMCFWAPGSGS